MDADFVTQKECEDRRQHLIEENVKQTADIARLYGEIKALNASISSMVSQNKWIMGLVSVTFTGMFIYLVTH